MPPIPTPNSPTRPGAETLSPLLTIRNLQVRFYLQEGIVRAVEDVNLEVYPGRTLGVIGESGCGKSVTAQAVLRILPSPPGRIVDGQILLWQRKASEGQPADAPLDLVRLDAAGREIRQVRGREIAMIFQEPMTSFGPMHTIGNQIEETILLHQAGTGQAEARAHTVSLLGQMGIPRPDAIANSYPHQISGGMRQRAMIALALSCTPLLLIADEPTTALDVTVQAQILELLSQLQATYGMAILFITHDLGVIAEVADEVAVMYLGRVVEQAPVHELFDHPAHPYTRALLHSIPRIDDTTTQRLESIRGAVPDPFHIPPGCAYADRCPDFMAGVCDRQIPDMIACGPNHRVRCFLYEETAADPDTPAAP